MPQMRSLAVMVAAACLPHGVLALGLGNIVGETMLGETVQAQIPLTGAIDNTLDNNCVLVRRPVDQIDPDYFPRDLVARLDKQPGGARLLLATRFAVRQPLLEFNVTITCGYNISRNYLIAVSPRAEMTAPRAQAAAAVSAQPVAASSRPVPVPQVVVRASTPAGTGNPDGLPGKDITLERDMTLAQLARQHFPGPLRQERFMRWVIEANPQLFVDASDLRLHKLAAGALVRVPVGVPPRRSGDYANGSSPLDAFGPAGRRSKPEAVAKPALGDKPSASRSQDRLVVGSGGGNVANYKEAVALVQRLTGMMEQQVAAQAANEERIKQLEAEVGQVREALTSAEAAAKQREAGLQARVDEAQRAQAEQAERAWWQVLIAVLVGGVLGAVLLQGVRRLRGDSEEAAGDAPSLAVEPEIAVPTETPGASQVPVVTPTPAPKPVRSVERLTPTPARTQSVPAPVRPAAAVTARKPKPDPASLDFHPPSFLKNDKQPATASATMLAETPVQQSDPATAAIELANIMTSMGLTESAAQTLVDHIRENPRHSLQHWLKLLELYRVNGKRDEFERSTQELRQHFNVQIGDWGAPTGAGRGTLENYPHIRNQLIECWHNGACDKYLHDLLVDNREGTRDGFPLGVAEEILLLIAIQSASQ